MKRFFILFLFLFPLECLFSIDQFLKWEKGQYVTYFTEYKNKRWEAYNISIIGEKRDVYFLDFKIITKKYGIEYLISAEENYTDVKTGLRILDFKVLRGRISEDTKALFISKIYNIFNIPVIFRNRLNKKENFKINKMGILGITNSYELIDEWKEFGYTLTHYINENVPILYIVGTDVSDKSFRTILTSYGNKNTNFSLALSYIDFYNLKEIDYGSFIIKTPSSWELEKRKDLEEENFSTFYYELGGINQSGYILVQIFNKSGTDILKLYQAMLDNRCLGENLKKGYDLKLIEEISDSTNQLDRFMCVYEFRQKDRIGNLLSAAIKTKDNRKCGAVSIFTTHKRGYESLSADERIKLFKEIVKSFGFK